MRCRAWMLALISFPMLIGCGAKPLPAPIRFAAEPVSDPVDPATNAWGGYLAAATRARDVRTDILLNRNPTPSMRREALAALKPAISIMIEASKRPCRVSSPLGDGLKSAREHRAWRMICRGLVWQIQSAVSDGDMAGAIRQQVIATKIGFDLAQGGAAEATIGYALVNDARAVLLPAVPGLGAGQLKTLAVGLANATPRDGGIERMVASESLKQRRTLDSLQDLVASKDVDAYMTSLLDQAVDLNQVLSDLARKPETRAPFFQNLGNEVIEEQRLTNERVRLPAMDRGDWPKTGRKNRAWAPVTNAYFRAMRAIIALRDETLARTRLLAAFAVAEQFVKAKQVAPEKLTALPESMRIDPYSGRSLLYQSVGSTFDVYSVGPNFRDDGGKTDESFAAPDLTLELR